MISFNSNDSTEKMEPETEYRPEVSKQVEKVVLNALKYNNPFTSIEKSIKILNEVPGSKFHLPESKYKIRKIVHPAFDFEVHYKCKKCQIYTLSPSKQAQNSPTKCTQCGSTLEEKGEDFFIYIPLQQQLRQSIIKNFDSIIQFKDAQRDQDDQFISDIRDASIHKKMNAKFPNSFNLSLVVNTDGAEVFDSATKALWPLQLIQNFLHPNLRYLTSNILLVGIIFIKGKPDPAQFFLPLIREIIQLHKDGFKIESMSSEIVFRPFITHCTCDLPAKAKCQCLTQFNGKFACGFCLHPGVSIANEKTGKTVRYIRRDTPDPLRTHIETVLSLAKLRVNPKKPILGFYSIPCFIAIPEFDLIHGFTIDYMHCLLIGTTSKLVGLWLDPKKRNARYHISTENKVTLNKRLLAIRPPSFITRKPRSLGEKEFFKANEWRSLLLYYLRYCLAGNLPTEYILHFELFSSATYILSKKKIHKNEIKTAREMLIRFADDFETLYGSKNVTMNVHLLRHIADAVLHSGPLWAQSMFAFEQFNGEIVKMVSGKNNILFQIAEKYILGKTLLPKRELNRCVTVRWEQYDFQPSEEDVNIFNKYGIITIDEITYWATVDIGNNEKYTSMVYRVTKSIDYFAVFVKDKMGKIKYYIKYKGIIYAVVENFRPIKINYHMCEVISKQSVSLFTIEEITEKLICIQVDAREIVCRLPNSYEKT